MRINTRSMKILISSVSVVGTVLVVKSQLSEQNSLKAFYQNNFEPSVKWDFDWDKYKNTLSISLLN